LFIFSLLYYLEDDQQTFQKPTWWYYFASLPVFLDFYSVESSRLLRAGIFAIKRRFSKLSVFRLLSLKLLCVSYGRFAVGVVVILMSVIV